MEADNPRLCAQCYLPLEPLSAQEICEGCQRAYPGEYEIRFLHRADCALGDGCETVYMTLVNGLWARATKLTPGDRYTVTMECTKVYTHAATFQDIEAAVVRLGRASE